MFACAFVCRCKRSFLTDLLHTLEEVRPNPQVTRNGRAEDGLINSSFSTEESFSFQFLCLHIHNDILSHFVILFHQILLCSFHLVLLKFFKFPFFNKCRKAIFKIYIGIKGLTPISNGSTKGIWVQPKY